jgi:hypothetical protein
MQATNHTPDFFRVVDLNPGTILQPVVDPRDPRGQCWFGFVSQEQHVELSFGTNPPPFGLRVLYTFDYDYFVGVGAVPATSSAKPHGILQQGTPTDQDERIITHHERSFIAFWIDPTGTQPATGQTVQVEIKAGRRD